MASTNKQYTEKIQAAASQPAISGQKLTPMKNNAASEMTEKLKSYAAGKPAASAQKLDKAVPTVKTGAVEAAKPRTESMTSSTADEDNDMAQALKARYDADKKQSGESMKSDPDAAAHMAEYVKAKNKASENVMRPTGATSDSAAKLADTLRKKTSTKDSMAQKLRSKATTGQLKSKTVDDDITAALQRAMRKRRPQ